MNFGNYGRDLLLELKRTDISAVSGNDDTANSLPPYNDGLVAGSLQDLKLHVQALNEQVEAASRSRERKPSMEIRPSLMLQEAAIQRNKRCLLAYHFVRLQRMQQRHYWQASVIENNLTEPGASDSMSSSTKNLNPAETEFLAEYEEIMSRYVSAAIPPSLGIVDLRTHAVIPPLTIDRVVVRVLDETPFASGPVVLESGQTVTFTVGSTHYLLYSDCEAYIRSGALQLLETEEHEG